MIDERQRVGRVAQLGQEHRGVDEQHRIVGGLALGVEEGGQACPGCPGEDGGGRENLGAPGSTWYLYASRFFFPCAARP